MNKYPVALSLSFIAGFSLAMLLNSSNDSIPETQVTKYSDDTSTDNMYLSNVKQLKKEESVVSNNDKQENELNISNNTQDDKQNNTNETDDTKLSPSEILLKHPPPHVADSNYFLEPGMNEQELIKLRQKSLDDHVSSMQQAGLPEEDIQASIAAFKQEIEDSDLSLNNESLSLDDGQPTITQEQLESDLSQSMNEAGESQENIQQMVDDLKTSNTDEHAPGLYGAADPETGLDHPEPPIQNE